MADVCKDSQLDYLSTDFDVHVSVVQAGERASHVIVTPIFQAERVRIFTQHQQDFSQYLTRN
jgi:hypothetical protein